MAARKDYAHRKAVEVLNDAVARRNLPAEVLETGLGAYHRIRYDLPIPAPVLVSSSPQKIELTYCLFV